MPFLNGWEDWTQIYIWSEVRAPGARTAPRILLQNYGESFNLFAVCISTNGAGKRRAAQLEASAAPHSAI